MHKSLLINLVMMFSASAMQQLGKLKNPVTNKVEIDLDGAQMTIDVLEMLKSKTRGNLDKDEDRLLTETVSMLQMNYVETADAAAKTKPAPTLSDTAEPGESADAVAEPPRAEPPAKDAANNGTDKDDKERKFHKSYG
jgi:hypothetical protein